MRRAKTHRYPLFFGKFGEFVRRFPIRCEEFNPNHETRWMMISFPTFPSDSLTPSEVLTAPPDKETDVFVSEVETWLKKSNILLTGYVFEYDTNLS